MPLIYDNSNTAANRQAFLANHAINDLNIRTEILESWQRSEKAGVDPLTTCLSPPYPINRGYHRKWLYRKEVMQKYLRRLVRLLQNTDSVLFWVDEDLTVLYPYGNIDILKKLSAINFRAGANLNENIVGTNAVALASLNRTDYYVIGAEHYIEALQDYACSAVPFFYEAYDADDSIYGYSLVITPAENFNSYQHELLYFYSNLAKSQVKLQLFNTEISIKNEMVNLSVDQQDTGLLLVNNRGVIVRANTWFLNNFEVPEPAIRGGFIKDLFPELVFTLDCLQKKKAIGTREISIPRLAKKNNSFFIESQPIKKDGQVIGASIVLYSKKNIHKLVSRVANFNAHFDFEDLLGSSHIFLEAKTIAQNAALSNSNILITGESGTGKELFAQAIHNASNRKKAPFIAVNCAAIPAELISSELFGYEEGAFTGARKGGIPGKFELANKGTIFLDEIGEMPISMQSALLRVLEEKSITRLGSSYSSPIDVRVIAATNRNLLEAIDAKEFRLDLYYRLNVIQIELPSLRERRGDIHLLIDYYIREFNNLLGKNIKEVSPEAMKLLEDYNWPGNIRELRNIIERAVNLNSSGILTVNDLPKDITGYIKAPIKFNDYDAVNQDLLKEFEQKMYERNHIIDLMKKYNGNKARVAKELGITRPSLYRRLKSISYDTPSNKPDPF